MTHQWLISNPKNAYNGQKLEQVGKDEIKIKIGQLKKCSTVRFWESIWSDKKERKKTEGQVLRYQLIDFIYAESTLITSAQFSQN